MLKVRVPCAYQGGKQRISSQIVNILQQNTNSDTVFYDLCCGSGAISIELINRGVKPSNIIMLDISSWGVFYKAIGDGSFNINKFDNYLSKLPTDKNFIKDYMNNIAKKTIVDEAELYPILQACSFGGKQIYKKGNSWSNVCFRSYWMPTKDSVRKSPANPMQPSPKELRNRICIIAERMKGITCINDNIMSIVNTPVLKNSIVYIDPPYKNTTNYAFEFNLFCFLDIFKKINDVPVFVSEAVPLNEDAKLLFFGGSNGGISGNRKNKHQEWISKF